MSQENVLDTEVTVNDEPVETFAPLTPEEHEQHAENLDELPTDADYNDYLTGNLLDSPQV